MKQKPSCALAIQIRGDSLQIAARVGTARPAESVCFQRTGFTFLYHLQSYTKLI